MKPFTELLIRVILIISIINSIVFYLLWNKPEILTISFAIGITIITIIVLVITLWFVLIFKQRKKK
jgi:membrane protein YdbS with pleckstrin-like domain